MDSIIIQNITIACDTAVTKSIYEQIVTGSPEQCGCADCRNFLMQRLEVHPPEAIAIFKSLGIDFRKESEIWNAEHFYNGWFHFVGQIISGEENIVQITPNYKLEFSSRKDLLPKEFGDAVVGQVEFFVENIPRIVRTPEFDIGIDA